MPESIDDFARRWKAQPDAAGAIHLCEMLRQSSPIAWGPLVDEVGKLASAKYAEDGKVLVAVAKLYASVERLSDAQGALVSAGRVMPKDPGVFRLLGEVLLRRGDAERAEKVLLRAQQLGANDADTTMWLDRAKVFKPVQAKAGARAVAVEVKNTAVVPVTPHPGMLPQGRPPAASVDDEAYTVVRDQRPAFPAAVEEPKRAPAPSRTGASDGLAMHTEVEPRRPVHELADEPLGRGDDFARRPTGPTGGFAFPPGGPPPVPAFAREAPPAFEPPPARRAPEPPSSEDATEVRSKPEELKSAAVGYAPPLDDAVVRPRRAAAAPPVAEAPMSMPKAREVLDALANAGVFEAREASAASIVWDRPDRRVRRKTAIGLSVAMVVFVGGAGGVLHEIHRRRALAHEEAEAALAKVEADLNASQASRLPHVEQSLAHAFELDSRSPRAAADWLEERAVKGLLQGGAEIAFEDAVARALEVGVPEDKVAYARVAAFLFQGDTGGAAGLMPKWDGPAAKDPLYQLITGATLARAGDPHAIERFQAAATLAPDLIVSEMLRVRTTAFDGDPKHPDRIEGAALVALAWGRDPARGEQPPPEVAEVVAHAGELPTPLLAVPHAVTALAAIDKKNLVDAKAALEKGLAVADDPGMATWLGSIALDTRDEPLVRKAALLAVTFSAVYAPARVLAGRIALLAGRLDEALKATEDLDATTADVAIIRSAASYERIDGDGVGRALETVPAETRRLPVFTALNLAPDVLLGRDAEAFPPAEAATKLVEMSHDEAPWSDLIAMDVALDLGLTDAADKIAADWKGTENKPLRAVRLSRLARYENRLDDADHLSKTALDAGTVTPRVLIERAFLLVAKNRANEVGPLLGKYPLVLGPASSWLSAYALASMNKIEEAKGRTAQLDFPPPLAPVELRVMSAISLATMKDKKRAEPAVKSLIAGGSGDPDLLAAAASLGIKVAAKPPFAPRRR
jgi:tetratricopeptide (TPR) repeat protein